MLNISVEQQTLLIKGALVTETVASLIPSDLTGFEQINLAGVTAFDSAGLAWLATYYAPSGCLFTQAPSSLRKLADLYGLTPLFSPA